MSRFEEKAIENMLYATDKVELNSAFTRECDYCCTHSCRSCKGCLVKTAFEGLYDGFEIAERRSRDIVPAR